MRYAFIREHKKQFGLKDMCSALDVSRSGYYEWQERPQRDPARKDAPLLEQIRRVHTQAREVYGAKKTWIELKAQGIDCGKHQVARLRKANGIEARRKRRFRLIEKHQPSEPAAPNLLQQCFRVALPNRVWVGDTTFIRTRSGFLHLAVLLDLYARRVVGWSMAERADLALVLGALRMAIEHRRPDAGVIHHTDRGSIYGARLYREAIQDYGLRPSMSAKGAPHDNAVAESFFSNLKNELVHHCHFDSRDSARTAIFDYIELFYNRRRRHQALGYISPVQFEERVGVS